MKRSWYRLRSDAVAASLAVTATFAVLLGLGLAWDVWQRATEISSALRYVPADATGLAVITPIEQLWPGAVAHLGYLFAAVDCPVKEPINPLVELAQGVKCALRDRGLDSEDLAQVRAHGLDITRPIVIAVRGKLAPDVPFIAAVPVLDAAQFQATLTKLFGKPQLVVADPVHTRDEVCRRGTEPQICLTFPTADLALVYNDRSLAAAALADPATNLAALRAYDALEVDRRLVDAAAGADTPWVWAHLRQTGLPLTGPATLMLKADQAGLGLAISFEFDTLGSRLLHRVADPMAALRNKTDTAWVADKLTLHMQDDDLAGYLTFLHDMAPQTAQQFEQELKPYDMVPEILRGAGIVPRLEVRIGRLRNGIPETAIGAVIDHDRASEVILRFQTHRRDDHDRALLDAAMQCLAASTRVPEIAQPRLEAQCPMPSVDAPRLWAGGDKPAFDATDFLTADYCGCIEWVTNQPPHLLHKGCDAKHGGFCPAGALRYSYLLPPVGDDDFRYGLISDSPDIDRQALKANQYRPAAAFDEAAGVLWIALDLDALIPTLDAARSRQSVNSAAAPDIWSERAKLRLVVDPTWLLAQARLSPVPWQRDFATHWRDELSLYRRAAVTLGSSGQPDRLLLTLHLDRD